MRTFVLSDIHGHYETFLKMLDLIGFRDKDFLYVVGDVVDRGEDGIELIHDIMKRKNVELFLGNHELMMLNAIVYERKKSRGLIRENPFDEHLTPYELWTHPANGGDETYRDFYALSRSEQNEIEEYLRSLRLIKRVKIGKKTFHISHSYSLNYRFGQEVFYSEISDREAESIVWESLFDRPADAVGPEGAKLFGYLRDIYIVGHIFTQRLNHVDPEGRGKIFRASNYRGYHVIDLDCGMALNSRSSRLGCMQLETMDEYYVPLVEDV